MRYKIGQFYLFIREFNQPGSPWQNAEARAGLASSATETATASPEEFAAHPRHDRERCGVVVREANIRAD